MKILIVTIISCILWLGCSRLSDESTALGLSKCEACHSLPPEGKLHSTHAAKGYDCTVCHSPQSHENGTVDVEISTDFDSSGVSSYNNQSRTCNTVYCHGNFSTGSHASISVSDTIGKDCNKCHNIPQLFSTGHHDLLPESVFQRCYLCHPGYNLVDSTTNDTLHVDQKVETEGCDICHELRQW